MKKCITAIVGVILMISLFGCGTKDGHDIYKEIYKRYNSMESYYAEAEVICKNDRSENVAHIRQFYMAPDKYSMVVDSPEEIAGSGYVFNGKTILVKSGFGKTEVMDFCLPDERSALCITDFFAEYYKSEETAIATASGLKNGDVTILECIVSGRKPTMFRQKLWIDNNTYLPVKLETYDVNNNVVVTIKYNEFKRNCDIDKTLFK